MHGRLYVIEREGERERERERSILSIAACIYAPA